jgi:hypothetical protein
MDSRTPQGMQGTALADLERSELMLLRGDDLRAAARALREEPVAYETRAGRWRRPLKSLSSARQRPGT